MPFNEYHNLEKMLKFYQLRNAVLKQALVCQMCQSLPILKKLMLVTFLILVISQEYQLAHIHEIDKLCDILIIHKNTDKATESILDGLLTAYSLQNKHNNSDIESLMTLIWNQKKEVQILLFHPNMVRF